MGEKKVKDFQPPTEEPREGFSQKDIEKGLGRPGRDTIEGFTGESSHADPDTTLRQPLRGDETKGDPDSRDIAGATKFEDTPHGREETKKDKAGAANQNG